MRYLSGIHVTHDKKILGSMSMSQDAKGLWSVSYMAGSMTVTFGYAQTPAECAASLHEVLVKSAMAGAYDMEVCHALQAGLSELVATAEEASPPHQEDAPKKQPHIPPIELKEPLDIVDAPRPEGT